MSTVYQVTISPAKKSTYSILAGTTDKKAKRTALRIQQRKLQRKI
jgi:hypothetical protein